MTVKEYIKHIEENGKYTFGYEECMQKFAKYKCQELLLLVAEKAKIKENRSMSNGYDYTERYVDKDSILNAVDLDSFIS